MRLMRLGRAVCPEVLVEHFAADAEFPGQVGLPLPPPAHRRSSPAFSGHECFPASAVDPKRFGQGDPFLLASTDPGPLEFGERPHDQEHQVRQRGSAPHKDQSVP